MDAAMHDALLIYFTGEKNASVFLGALGVAVIAAAAVLARTRSDLRSCAATLGIVALIEIAIGVGLHLRTGPQVSRLTTQLPSDPARLHSDEAARIARVQRNFLVIQY